MFSFKHPQKMVDGDLELILHDTYPGDSARGWVPSYRFKMIHTQKQVEMGRIDLRVGDSEHIVRYAGHIGYRVNSEYRGSHYAARACKLLLPFARLHELNPLWITCNPENLASRRTCEILGAQFVEIVDIPQGSEMYIHGDRRKCRYRLEL